MKLNKKQTQALKSNNFTPQSFWMKTRKEHFSFSQWKFLTH